MSETFPDAGAGLTLGDMCFYLPTREPISRRNIIGFLGGIEATSLIPGTFAMASGSPVIDDLSHPHPQSSRGTRWQLVSDQVMGGVSGGTMAREEVAGRPALRMRGQVSLENNGGFLQLALDLAPDGKGVDATRWTGIALDVRGDGETYNMHLRTNEVKRPWQSYRQSFTAGPDWHTVQLPFAGFMPHRLEAPLDLGSLRRIGLVAIGRAFEADLAIAGIRLFA